ncbi:MAG: ABC transporter ATP-binding protein [Chloroflexi bacterium]|nr:ABC transporter ATP-binding protein [Chloroflexota bacterium]
MSSNPAIKLEKVGKMFQLYNQPQDRLKQSIYPRLQRFVGRPARAYFREFWALRNISFEVEAGETVGIVGRNGSGKSTLLQIISGTLMQTIGTVTVNGRLTALLELGSGFNPEFTGRENVYLSGSILGFSREEMDAWFDDIAAFADIGDFIDQQVKFYSSGMYVRLAFATNIMVQPDIMIVDEALAVGDMKFQVKCMSALRRRQEAGSTILFVSHDINAIRSLCTRAIYLDAGQMRQIGPAVEVANAYFKAMREEIDAELTQFKRASSAKDKPVMPRAELPDFKDSQLPRPEQMRQFEQSVSMFRMGAGGARILYADLLDDQGGSLELVEFNQSVWVRILFESHEEKELTVNFYIKDDKNIPITGSNLALSNHPLLRVKPGERFLVKYHIPALPLQHGIYSLNVSLMEPTTSTINAPVVFVDYIENALVFNVASRKLDKIWAKVFLFPTVDVVALN